MSNQKSFQMQTLKRKFIIINIINKLTALFLFNDFIVSQHPQWTCSLARRTEPPHHLAHQYQLALLESH
jgi:hypothetical protein